MPTWLMTALVIILVLWTFLDLVAWKQTYNVYEHCQHRGTKFDLRKNALNQTIVIVVCWIVLICYWLR